MLAVSNTLGDLFRGCAATATNGPKQDIAAWSDSVIAEDLDVRDDIW